MSVFLTKLLIYFFENQLFLEYYSIYKVEQRI